MVQTICSTIQGDAPIMFTWLGPDGNMFSTGTGISLNVTIPTASSGYGNYKCVATNSYGSSNSTVTIIQALPPTIQVQSRYVEVKVNQTLHLSAVITFNYQPSSIIWMFNGNNVMGSSRIVTSIPLMLEVPLANISLAVSSVIPSDAGEYIIFAASLAGNTTTPITVNVTAPATIIQPIQNDNLEFDVNTIVILQCSARGLPAPTFTWSPSSDRYQVASTSFADSDGYAVVNSTLTISRIVREDLSFTCTASNSIGMDSHIFRPNVNFPPTNVTPQATMVQVLSPQSVTLSCTAEGLPLPTFVWTKVSDNSPEVIFNSSTTQINSKTYTISTSMGASNFTISPTSATDSASYKCVAANRLGNSSNSVNLTVHEMPQITYPMKQQQFTVNEQSDITITCTATGSPAPAISFYYYDQELGPQQVQSIFNDRVTLGPASSVLNSTTNIHVVSRNITLTNAMDSDSGSLICSALSNIPVYGMRMMNVSFSLLVYIAANITNPPSPKTVTSPTAALFTCMASGLPRPDITWTNPDGNIIASDQTNVEIKTMNGSERSVTSSLNISTTSPSVSGSYMCNASNGVVIPEVITSVMVELTVYVIPDITSYLPEGSSRYVVNVTDDITFQCTATGVPPPDIQWYRGNDKLNSSTSRVTLGTISIEEPNRALATVSRVLTLAQASTSDNGTYSCRATNAAMGGEDYEDFELYVQVPPRITRQSDEILANSGDSIVLTFIISDAIPEVQINNIQWYYTTSAPAGIPNFNSTDFQEITNLMSRTTRSMLRLSENKLSLNISNIVQSLGNSTETDQGRYFIRASNPAGDVNNFIDVVVRGPPQIVGGPEDREVLGGSGLSVTFSCQAIANPLHNISWSYEDVNGTVIDDIITTSSANSSKYQIFAIVNETSFGQLTVLNIEYNDRGTYICTAANIVGEVMDSGTLTVQVAPTFINGGITSPRNTTLNNSVAIFCHATGFPMPSITWRKNGASFDGSYIIMFTFLPRLVAIENDTVDFMSSEFDGSITELIMSNDVNTDMYNTMNNQSIVGVLLFDQVSREHNGNYTCVASNKLPMTSVANITSRSVQLVVLERPDPPVNVSIHDVGPLRVLANWTPTYNGNRIVSSFKIYIRDVNESSQFSLLEMIPANTLTPSNGMYSNNFMNNELIKPFTHYSVQIESCNAINCSDRSVASAPVRTDEYTSSPPQQVSVTSPTSTNLTVRWEVPSSPNGVITRYMVSYRGSKPYNASFRDDGDESLDSITSGLVLTLFRLTPGTVYSIQVAAVNGAEKDNGLGQYSLSSEGSTLSVPPPPPPQPPSQPPSPLIDNPRTYTLKIVDFSEMNGPISHYHIIVIILPEGQSVNSLPPPDERYNSISDLNTYSRSLCDQNHRNPLAYISAEFGRNLLPDDGKFVVGADDNSGKNSPNDQSKYTNGPLCNGFTYTFFIRAYTDNVQSVVGQRTTRNVEMRQYDLFTSSGYYSVTTIEVPSSNAAGIAIGIIIVILLIVLVGVVVAILFVLMKQKQVGPFRPKASAEYKMEKLNGDPTMEYVPPVSGSNVRYRVPLSAFADHVENMHLNENCGFFEEYRVIQDNSPMKPSDTCCLAENKSKNRYANINCFEETRVVLKPVEGADYDYVNANHIDGYNRPREYIAAQGPLPVTVNDMWRVVWEYNVPTIVMLTNLVEKMKIKCSQYWPDSDTLTYGIYEVTLTNTISLSDFVIRCMSVKNTLTGETKDVRQYHYISWPDFGVPRHATPLLYFIRKIRSMHKYSDERPILVHCSAGVGRTGTLITIDHELQRAAKENSIDAFNYVTRLRQQRNFMVQTDAQYVFLHDALLEGTLSGNTEVSVERLGKHMKMLEKVDEEEESGYLKEFQQLRQFKVKVSEFSDANEDCNRFKNRLANALPYNYNRVILKMKAGTLGSDYINASFIDGYTKKRTYIATQDPLENTREDFWRMVWEKSVSVVVMLTQLEEKEKEQSVQYWPSSINDVEKFGDFTAELTEEGSFEDYVARDLKIVELSSESSRTIKHFHFTAWPEHGAPESGVGMVDLIDQVTRKQQQTGDNPIIVHCSAGIGRTGAFCCLSTAIERVKAEGMVDVFYNIKHLRTQRAHMVQSVEQYTFCYKALLEYVQSLNNYSNFQ